MTISTPFYMGGTEVTQGQWNAVMDTQPWRGQSHTKAGADNPASYVSWDDATAFCKAMSKKIGRTVRLPTEAEWEYACRAGTRTRFSFGDGASWDDYVWYHINTHSKNEEYAHPVGAKKPNAWGLYDMHGNLWELCADWYVRSYANADARDPKGPPTGKYRVRRGGSWDKSLGFCSSAFRATHFPGRRENDVGFRVVVESGSGVD